MSARGNQVTDREELQRIVDAGQVARVKLREMDDEIARRENAKLIGKCFRFRNCYSCPETEADYWWTYIKVVDLADEGDSLIVFKFQTDSKGEVAIAVREHMWKIIDGYEECLARQFHMEWTDLMNKLKAVS